MMRQVPWGHQEPEDEVATDEQAEAIREEATSRPEASDCRAGADAPHEAGLGHLVVSGAQQGHLVERGAQQGPLVASGAQSGHWAASGEQLWW